MKKLKVYKNPDFRFLEMHCCVSICGISTKQNIDDGDIGEMDHDFTPGGDGGGADNADAGIFRKGIWDEE